MTKNKASSGLLSAKFEKNMMKDEEFASDDFLLISMSLLESKGYTGFLELQAVVDDAEIIVKILRLMAGMNIKIPSLSDFALSLKTCTYIYYMLLRDNSIDLKNENFKDIVKEKLHITAEEEQLYLAEFERWYKYILKQGYDLEDFVKITKKTKSKVKNNMRRIKNEFRKHQS